MLEEVIEIDQSNNKFAELVDKYFEYVNSVGIEQHVALEKYKFDDLNRFRSTFDLNAVDLASMLNESLPNDNLVVSGSYYPKKMLVIYAQAEPETIRSALNVLYDESRPIEPRISEYEQIISDLNFRQNAELNKTNSSYNDARFISLLLSFRYPAEYTYYKSEQLLSAAKIVYGDDKSIGGDNIHKVKFAAEFGKSIQRELLARTEFTDLRLSVAPDAQEDNLWFAEDAYYVIGRLQRQNQLHKQPVAGTQALQYWIYSPGRNAERFDKDVNESVMALNYDVTFDLKTVASKDDLKQKLVNQGEDSGMNKVQALADISHVMKKGDVVFAKKGVNTIIGYGIVTSDYIFDDASEVYQHVRSVQWKKTGEWNYAGKFDDTSNFAIKTLTNITSYSTLISNLKQLIGMDEEKEKNTVEDSDLALNTILYGPPGTGKTYSAIEEYAKDLLSGQSNQEMSAEEVLADEVKSLTWWQVIAVSLYAHNDTPLKIRDILNQPVVQSYSKFVKGRTSKNVYGTVSTTLIERSDATSSNSTYRMGVQEYFHKNENSEWTLTEEGRAYVEAELSNVPTQASGQHGTDWHKFFRTITFHQSYSYEEFVEGIRPKLDGDVGGIAYEIKDGIFKELCSVASQDPDNKYLLIIDEINRGNIAKIFGELITLLEDGKRETMSVRLPYSQDSFTVPKNLYVLGTMNTADRSIALLDIALRRRFEFVELMPKNELLSSNIEGTGLSLAKLLEQLNQKISIMIDRDHQIGHSYLMEIDSLKSLNRAWYKKILPLIQEYFYNDWEKLEILLGKSKLDGTGFVTSKIVKFPGDGDLDDTTLHDIHQYTDQELVKALKALVVDEKDSDSNTLRV